ncbi:MAG: hypothetical protein ACRD82_05850 [Blastocatellia bacterium]
MDKTITLEMTKDEAEQLNELLKTCLAVMDRTNEQMVKDNQEIERSQARTWIILSELQRSFNYEHAN